MSDCLHVCQYAHVSYIYTYYHSLDSWTKKMFPSDAGPLEAAVSNAGWQAPMQRLQKRILLWVWYWCIMDCTKVSSIPRWDLHGHCREGNKPLTDLVSGGYIKPLKFTEIWNIAKCRQTRFLPFCLVSFCYPSMRVFHTARRLANISPIGSPSCKSVWPFPPIWRHVRRLYDVSDT